MQRCRTAKLSAIAADKMNTLIRTELHDADWLRQFGDFIYNFVVSHCYYENPSSCDETVEALGWTTYGSGAQVNSRSENHFSV